MIIFGRSPPSWSVVAAAAVLTGAVILATTFGVVIALAFVLIVVILLPCTAMRTRGRVDLQGRRPAPAHAMER